MTFSHHDTQPSFLYYLLAIKYDTLIIIVRQHLLLNGKQLEIAYNSISHNSQMLIAFALNIQKSNMLKRSFAVLYLACLQ